MIKIWKDILKYKGTYQVSNFGKVKSFARYKLGKLICLKEDKDGYCVAQLHQNKIRQWIRIHRLVVIAFIPNSGNKPQVNHKDGNKKNNCVDNLEWATCSENVQHAYDKLGKKGMKGETHPNCKLTKNQVQKIKDLLNKNNVSQRLVGKTYSISQSQISRIKNNQRWRHLI